MKESKYYSLAGSNGFGVYNELSYAKKDLERLDHGSIDEFASYYDAMDDAIERYSWIRVIMTGELGPYLNKECRIVLNTLSISPEYIEAYNHDVLRGHGAFSELQAHIIDIRTCTRDAIVKGGKCNESV